jgi:hypothetical protein
MLLSMIEKTKWMTYVSEGSVALEAPATTLIGA